MLTKKISSLYFICSECGMNIKGKIDMFNFSGYNECRIICPECGEHYLAAKLRDDGQISVTVPCVVCEQSHRFILSPSVFFGEEPFLLSCPVTDFDICALGSGKKTAGEFRKLEDKINLLFLGDLQDDN